MPKPRVGFFYIPHGMIMDNTPYGKDVDAWTPTGSGANFTLSLQNATPGAVVSYQWYSSTVSGAGPWTPVGTNAPTFITNQTAASWYYCDVTCSVGPVTT